MKQTPFLSAMEELTAIAQIVTYCPATGEFLRIGTGERADKLRHSRYRCVRVLGRKYYAHRLAWLFSFGAWPDAEIDHRNGDPGDNRIANLRAATRTQNCGNVVKQPGACGFFGVSKQANTSRYRSSITVNKKRHHIGYFDTIEAAHMAAVDALDKFRGEFSPATRIAGAQ